MKKMFVSTGHSVAKNGVKMSHKETADHMNRDRVEKLIWRSLAVIAAFVFIFGGVAMSNLRPIAIALVLGAVLLFAFKLGHRTDSDKKIRDTGFAQSTSSLTRSIPDKLRGVIRRVQVTLSKVASGASNMWQALDEPANSNDTQGGVT